MIRSSILYTSVCLSPSIYRLNQGVSRMPPKSKKPRLDKPNVSTVASNTDDPNSGVIQFEVDHISTLDETGRFSPEVEVGRVPCFDNIKSTEWSMDVKSEFIIVNSDSSKNATLKSKPDTFRHLKGTWGSKIIAWDEAIDEEKGFINNDKIIAEIHFTIISMKGIWMEQRFDSSFAVDNRTQSAFLLMMEGKPVIAKKQSLFSSIASLIGNTEGEDQSSSGFISFEASVTDIGIIRSPEIKVHGTSWSLGAKKITNSSHLEVYLYNGGSESNIWSIDVSADLSITNHTGIPPVVMQFKKTFDHENNSWGFPKFHLWDDLITEEKGFIKNGKITIEARFTLTNIEGIRTIPRIDFSDPNDLRHDVALVINGEKIYVGKQILAFHSPVFNTMFFGQFVERTKKEIELKGINGKEFIQMLNLIYPSYETITDVNAEYLLRLADRFQIKMITDQVEKFLIESTKLDVPAKLKLTDLYRLVELQDHCIDSFKTVNEITALRKTEGYKVLSDKAKLALMDKAMKLTEEAEQ